MLLKIVIAEGREGSCVQRIYIYRGRGVVKKVKAGEYEKVSVRCASISVRVHTYVCTFELLPGS